MLKIVINNEDRIKTKSIIESDSFFKDFQISENEEGFEIDGMKYCTIAFTLQYGQFTLIDKQDRALNEVISETFKEVPGIEIKGSLLLGDDNYRHFYWMYSEPGKEETTIDYAIDISEFGSVVNSSKLGVPLSSTWYHCLYGTDYGAEYIYFKTIDDLRESVKSALSNLETDAEDKKLGLNLMEIYKFMSEVMDTPVGDLEDLKDHCSKIKKKYEKEDKNEDEISDVIKNNFVPMASAISGMTIYEVWANAVKKAITKSKFFKLFKIEEDLEDLENEDYINLLAQIAEDYEGFSGMECDDFIDLCDEYGLSSEIDEDDYDAARDKIEELDIPEFDSDLI